MKFEINKIIVTLVILIIGGALIVNALNNSKSELEIKVSQEVKLVNTFYKFNLTPDGTVLTDEQIKLYGGDCEDWTNYYARHLNEFTTDKVIFSERPFTHEILIVSDENTYCVIDQTYYHCNNLKYFKNE